MPNGPKNSGSKSWWVYARPGREMPSLWARNAKLAKLYWVSPPSEPVRFTLKQEFQRW